MTQNHMQEPWSFDKYDNIVAGEEQLLLGGIRTPMTAGPRMDEGRANARRIVACVNACAGWETSQLEAMELGSLKESLVRVMQQRDELLAALRVAEGFVSEVSEKTGFGQVHTLKVIQAAITKTTGETK